jgi:hypothetical protein
VTFPGLSCLSYKSHIFVQVKRNLNFSIKYSWKSTITNFTKILPVGGTLVHMDNYNETNRRISTLGRILHMQVLGARHGKTHQCLRLTDVTLNFDNDQSTDAVFLDTEKSFHTTWHSGLIYKLLKLNFSDSTVKFGEL